MSCTKQYFDKDDEYYKYDDCTTCPGKDVQQISLVKHPIKQDGNINLKINYCYNCGTIVKDQKYCQGCGKKLMW